MTVGAADRRAVLDAFARDLGRETHVLAARPELTWQQLHNRLQWRDEAVERLLAPERTRRSASGTASWLRTQTRLRESEALVAILAGHSSTVGTCAISPDGAFVVSAGDTTLRISDPASGGAGGDLAPRCSVVLGAAQARPLVVCGDIGGNAYILDLVGIEYGPIIVTAVDFGGGPAVRCPSCLTRLPLQKAWIGEEVRSSEAGCEGRMRVNPVVVGPHS